MKRFFLTNWGGFAVAVGLGLAFSALVVLMVYAQDKPGDPKPIPDAYQNKILKLQLHQQQIATEYQNCATRNAAIPGEFNTDNAKIGEAINEALKEMKLDPEKWTVDLKAMTAVAKAPTPEKPKEEPKK